MREVEPCLLRVHQRSFLVDFAAQHFAQRPVHQMRGGVIAHGVGPGVADFEGRRLAALDVPLNDAADLQHGVAEFLRIFDLEATRRRCDETIVANLAALFRVEVGAVQQ